MADENSQYSEQNFWSKLKSAAVVAGREVIEKALTLFYAAQRPETPLWAKMTIYSALTYLILPADAIPDFLPISGYVDDLGTLAAAIGAVAMCITPEIKEQASQQAKQWFKDDEEPQPRSTPTAEDTLREIAID
jgi:uncharacterized membrane protein YkvA (DUF1232 family)